MSKLTVAEAAEKLGVSREAIHNRVRRGSLESVVEDGIKYVLLDAAQQKTAPSKARNYTKAKAQTDERYYKFLEEQNAKLQNRVEVLETETRMLREQKEQMLIAERQKIEEIYKQKDEQLKNILNAISSKFMLETPANFQSEPLEAIEEAEVEEIDTEYYKEESSEPISLKKYLLKQGCSEKKMKKFKKQCEKLAKTDERFEMRKSKVFIDPLKYSYEDILGL